jgi:AsmA protein
MKRSVKKWLKLAAISLVVLAIGAPFVPAGLFRARIQYALEQALGRKVEIGEVHFTLLPGALPGPGFTVDQVLIHEDPRAGIEPFAYVESLGATVRLLSLFRQRLEFSSLNLGDATVNVVQSAAGPWNFQYLVAASPANARALPSIRMRGGRVNFKFGDTKSVFYFNNADLDVSPGTDGSFELRFGGAPSRTDRTAQDFGRLFIRGGSSASHRLNFTVELERSGLEETLRWFMPGGLGVHGTVTFQARLSGPPSELKVAGSLEIGDVHRWDVLPAEGSGWRMNYEGTLDLPGERLELVSTSRQASPLTVRLHAAKWLSSVVWDASAEIRRAPVETLMEIARHMGAPVPEGITATGDLSGSLRYDPEQGLAGRVELGEATFALPGAEPVRAASAVVGIADGAVRLERTSVHAGDGQSADVEVRYSLAGSAVRPGELDFRIVTRGMDVAHMRSFAMAVIPVIRDTPIGVWRGSARYRAGVWSGDFELRGGRFAVGGLAEPVEVESALVALNGSRVRWTKVHARAGGISFSGDYRFDPDRAFPHRFTALVPEAGAGALWKLLAPTAVREAGFLSRTLRLGSAPKPPEWLKARRAEGSVVIESLVAEEAKVAGVTARILWDGAAVQLTGVTAHFESGTLVGDAQVSLAERMPHVAFTGTLDDLAYRGGVLTLEGMLEAGGDTRDFFGSLHAEGALRGHSIAFAPDAEFRMISGDFEVLGFGPLSKWRLANLEIHQGDDVFTGSGSTQADGKLQLDLASRGRQFRFVAAAVPGQP